mmetsp:Transcript_38089/g.81307  ORF Transcript_38089/g.81307 Transcript_38089/m.81307 type:complete len:171 (+) Transcript_38089:165-677(+)|eukprot:CAMPEP_0172532656 /NCGR_PEP_ID=MMETSP1067-20121228/5628_1 /TAXON_ID=265564 ORGANISM="Thalassiosira punctigera, Strain Tpunct2005C2" /NCGR_SAMPLE_ID=MMETSP1067 /ASSEMBLY_ACC=CAM_ASM_000444 /LENGTH=170 /DNA_ID=CAMNT_0013317197 /DNA_START=135 /DNA_END=647 /DNA_ORIENTATION=-
MPCQPLRRSPRLAAKTAAKAHAHKPIPGILRVSKTARHTSMSQTAVKFGRNAVAEFEKENPPGDFEQLTNDEAEQLFPHEVTTTEQTRINEEILSEWDELFDDLDQSDESTVGSDESSIEFDHEDRDKSYFAPHDNGGDFSVEEIDIDNLNISSPTKVKDHQPKREKVGD